MKKILVYLCFTVGLDSCCGPALQKQLEQFTRKEIIIPGQVRQMSEGCDTVVLNLGTGAVRFVMWTDSVACSTCKVNKMFEYNDIICFREEAGNDFVPVFIFSPPRAKVGEVIQTLEFSGFDYPVFIDENQAFPKANPHIPADNRFHTFLLDRNGKVVLVGDPVNNPQLGELYKSTITTLIENGGTLPPPEPPR